MRQQTKKQLLLQPRMRCSAMRVTLVQMMKRTKEKKTRKDGVAVGAEVEAKAAAEAEVTVEVDLRAVERVRAIELLLKM